MNRRLLLASLVAIVASFVGISCASAQAEGTVAGIVQQKESRAGLPSVEVLVDDRIGAVTDTGGRYRVRAVRSGWHRVAARLIGYRGVVLDSVFVPAGATVAVDFDLESNPTELEPVVVTAPYDAVLDPLATSTEQKMASLCELVILNLNLVIRVKAYRHKVGIYHASMVYSCFFLLYRKL